MSKLESATVKAISRELMDALTEAFPPPKVTDYTDLKDHDKILWQHAQHAVVEWIRDRVNVVGKG